MKSFSFVFLFYFLCLPIFAVELMVSGEGEASAEPDQAMLSFEVTSLNKQMNKAQSEVATKVEQVKKIFQKKFKVDPKELKTSSFSSRKQYEYPHGGARVFKGYQVSHSLELKVLNISLLGEMLDVLSDQNVSRVGNPSFLSSKEKELKTLALKDAVKNAAFKAQAISESLRKKVKKIESVTESSFSYHEPFLRASGGIQAMAMKSAASTEIVSDKVKAHAKVAIKYILE